MAAFGIRFFLSNIFLCAIICTLLIVKRVLRSSLTSRMHYHLWFVLLGLLVVPFLSVRPVGLPQVFAWLAGRKHPALPGIEAMAGTAAAANPSDTAASINDFALSVSSRAPSVVGAALCWIWLIGMFAMLLFLVKSGVRLSALKKSALPLQSRDVRTLYDSCLNEMKIKKSIPIYSTAFLKSPVIAGLFRPCIYLPIHLISDYHAADMRFMLLHELQHYRHRDALAGYLMNLAGVLYWFNPFVWYALKEMRNDREIACDASVLSLLEESDYEAYGNTLIHLAEKLSSTPFPFAAAISGNMKQMKKRILMISTYQKPSLCRKLRGLTAFCIIAVLLLGLTPVLSTYAADQEHYNWKIAGKRISEIDLSAYFSGYEGSFVLYDRTGDTWSIYNMDRATLRTAPNSTYKIYDALFGLEEGIITPEASSLAWNKETYPFEAWNANQDLYSAMEYSVNWYFEEIDRQLGDSALKSLVQEIGYGNERIDANRSMFEMQSPLKISPVEQVELLAALYSNQWGFAPENIDAVKEALCLFSSEDKRLYGKTGTGSIDGQDVNGWFVGFVEAGDNTYFFAVNIQGEANAAGSRAAEIANSILAGLKLPGHTVNLH